MIEEQPYQHSNSQQIHQEPNSQEPPSPESPGAPIHQEEENLDFNEELRPTEQQIRKRKKARAREVEQAEANEFLQQPVVKIVNLNKDLKRAYEKGFLDESKYDFIKTLRKKRRHPEQDSVSSHYNSDESWDIREALPKRGFQKKKDDILSSSDSGQERPPKKRVTKPKDPNQPKKTRQPRQPKPPQEPKEPRPLKPRQVKSKQPIKKEEDDKVKQEKELRPRLKNPLPEPEPRKNGVTIKITKAPPGMEWEKNGNKHAKRINSESEASLNQSESSFKTSSGDESEEKIIAAQLNKDELKVEESKVISKEDKRQREIAPAPQPKIQERNHKQIQPDNKMTHIKSSNAQPFKQSFQQRNEATGDLKKLEQRPKNEVAKAPLSRESDSMSNSSSSQSSSSSSSSSQSSSDSSEDDSKARRRRKHKKHKYSSSDDSSSEDSKKKKKKHHKSKSKKHKKEDKQKPTDSLITAVIKQQLSLKSSDKPLLPKDEDIKSPEAGPERNVLQKGSENAVPEAATPMKAEEPQKGILYEIQKIRKEEIVQSKGDGDNVRSMVPEVQKEKAQVSERQALEVEVPASKDLVKASQQLREITTNPVRPTLAENSNKGHSFKESKSVNRQEEKYRLKPILKEASQQLPEKRPSVQINSERISDRQSILQKNEELQVSKVKQEVNQEAKEKQLSLDNRVVVLQLMVGSSEKPKQPKTEQSRQEFQAAEVPKKSAYPNKQHRTIRSESEESEELSHYSNPTRTRFVPQKVVRYRKVMVQSSDDTESSVERMQERRVVRRVRRPYRYESRASESEDEATDYRVSAYRQGRSRREEDYGYHGYR